MADHDPNSSFPRPSTWRRLRRASFLFIGTVAVFLGVIYLYPTGKPKPIWTASDAAPPPGDFLYAMFPVNNTVDLRDVPDGAIVGTLRRAVVNSQEEIDAGGWVRVHDASASGWVRLSDLGYLSPSDADTDYFGAFVPAYQSRAPSEFRDATLDLLTNKTGVTTASLRLRPDDDHVEIYVYEIAGGRVKPLEMTRYFGPGETLKSLGPAVIAGVAAAAFLAIAGVAAGRRRR